MVNRVTEPVAADGVPAGERVPGGWVHLAALAGLTLVGLYFCYRLADPFLPALAWAVALAVVADPLHEWLARRLPNRVWSAAVATTVVVLVIVVPVVLVAGQLAVEAATASRQAEEVAAGGWREAVARVPGGADLLAQLDGQINVEAEVRKLLAATTGDVRRVAEGSVAGLLQALAAVFILFFAFKDRDRLLAGVRDVLPVSRVEADHLFTRTSDAVHATVYGTFVASVVQGATGGLLFWALGLPAPVVWGVVMTVLGVLPFVGAFLVWVPAAVALALEDRWGAALALVAWGLIMAGPVCNWLYGCTAGSRLRLHPVPALLAFIGGLAVFGVSGMVLGPVVLAVTLALIEMWRRRAGAATIEGKQGAVILSG